MSNLNVVTNIMAENTHRNMKAVGSNLAKASRRLSSGYRINNAADDAAGMAISERMKAQIRGLEQAQRNTEDGKGLVTTMEGGMSEIQNMVIRQRELVVQALNDTNTNEDRAMMEQEIDQLTMEIADLADNVEFNQIPLLNVNGFGISYEVNDDTVMTGLGGFNAVTNPPVSSDGSLNFNATNNEGEISELIYGYGNTSYNFVRVTQGGSEVVLDVRGQMTQTGATTGDATNGWTTEWSYNQDGFDFTVTQKVEVEANSTPPGGQMYNVAFEFTNNSADNCTIDFKSSVDTLFRNSGGSLDDNPVYWIDDGKVSVDQSMVFPGAAVPDGKVNMYVNGEHSKNPNLSVQLDVNGCGADSLYLGAWGSGNTTAPEPIGAGGFDFTPGSQVYDSAFALAWNNKSVAAGGTVSGLTYKYGVIDPQQDVYWQGNKTVVAGDLWIQSGANQGQGMYVTRYDCTPEALGLSSIALNPREAAEQALIDIDNAFGKINMYRATAGAQFNRLEFTEKAAGVASLNLSDANSRLADADMAKEMMNYTKGNVLQQAAVAMLTQARSQPENLLQLLR